MERTRFEQEMDNLGISERFFESAYFPKFDYDTSSSSIPALMKLPELSPKQQTLYVNISLGNGSVPGKINKKIGKAEKHTVQPMTGIFIPQSFALQKEVDIVLYLHGHKGASPGNDVSIDGYWNGGKVQHFALREEVNESGRNIIFVAPTLGPLSQVGNLTSTKGFDSYLEKVLAALNEHFIKNLGQKIEGFRNIILSAHSGGGSPMLRIAELKGSVNTSKISECWGFDSVYGDVEKRWVDWAASHPQAKLFFYYSGTASKSKYLEKLGIDRNLQNICVHGWSGKDFSDWEKSHPNLKKSSVGSHFWIPIVYLKERLQNSPCRTKQSLTSPNNAPAPKKDAPFIFPTYSDDTNTKFQLTKVELFKGKIKVASAGSKEMKTYVVITESPAVFLPEIVRIAKAKAIKDKKNDIAVKLNPDSWFNEFTRNFTFLGRPFKDGQFVHIEFAKMLKSAESGFMKIIGSSDAKKTGDILLNNSDEGISGSRKTSSTATFSMHMFGLAVDVNYRGNPYVEASDIKPLNNVLKNAALLMNTDILTYEKNTKGKFKDRFDYMQALDTLLENYFKLPDNTAELERHIRNSQSSVWRGQSLADAKAIIQKNLNNLAGFLARGKLKDYFKKHAILDFDKRFVVGMEAMGFDWGGYYGDMMHFDMRKTGVGYYIEKARKEYGAKVKNQAKYLLKEKKYGEHQL